MRFDFFKSLVKHRQGERARRICTNCSEQNDDSAKNCSSCGHLFGDLKARLARQCPAGHTMDPNWTKCPYCEQERQNGKMMATDRKIDRTKTRVEGQSAPFMPAEHFPPAANPEPEAYPSSDNSRIVGVLITYSRSREGEIFPIREGKNFIGKSEFVSGGAPCDICFPEDGAMSNEHALILYRRGEYLIFDQQSTNGTFVNRKSVHFRGEELPNYAEIKAGFITFTFVKAEANAPEPAPAPEPESPGKWSPERPR